MLHAGFCAAEGVRGIEESLDKQQLDLMHH